MVNYKLGIIKALTELDSRTGSSSIATKKSVQANFHSDKKWCQARFLSALRRMVANGILVKKSKFKYKLNPPVRAKKVLSKKKSVYNVSLSVAVAFAT
jgi:hypothetical protein